MHFMMMLSPEEKTDKKMAWIQSCMDWASRESERERQEEKDIDEMNEEQERQRAEEQPATPDVNDSESGCPTEWLELSERKKTERRSPLAHTPSTQTDSFDLEVGEREVDECIRRQSGHYRAIEVEPFHSVCGNCFCGSCKRPREWTQKLSLIHI